MLFKHILWTLKYKVFVYRQFCRNSTDNATVTIAQKLRHKQYDSYIQNIRYTFVVLDCYKLKTKRFICSFKVRQLSRRFFNVAQVTCKYTLLKECGPMRPIRLWSAWLDLNVSSSMLLGCNHICTWSCPHVIGSQNMHANVGLNRDSGCPQVANITLGLHRSAFPQKDTCMHTFKTDHNTKSCQAEGSVCHW